MSKARDRPLGDAGDQLLLRRLVLADIGGVRETMGEYNKATVMYREALRIDKEHEQFIGVAKDLHVLGRLHEKRGELDLAAEYHARALNVYRIRIGHGPWIISQLHTLLRIARLRKDKAASAEYQRLLDAFKKPLPEKKEDGEPEALPEPKKQDARRAK